MKSDRALVIGEALIDQVDRGDGTPITEIPGGSPANVALGLGRLQRTVRLACWLGPDDHGRTIAEHLLDSGVELAAGSIGAARTSTALARIGADGAAKYEFDLEWAPPPASPQVDDVVVHTGSIAAILEPGRQAVVRTLREARGNATISYDPNARPALMGEPEQALAQVQEIVALADVVKLSDEDVAWLTNGRPIAEVAREWLRLGPALVVVTRGGEGVSAWLRNGANLDLPAAQVNVVDTVGAGDSFMGGIIDALWSLDLLGGQRRQALQAITAEQVGFVLRHARAIAAITVSRQGANPPWSHEL